MTIQTSRATLGTRFNLTLAEFFAVFMTDSADRSRARPRDRRPGRLSSSSLAPNRGMRCPDLDTVDAHEQYHPIQLLWLSVCLTRSSLVFITPRSLRWAELRWLDLRLYLGELRQIERGQARRRGRKGPQSNQLPSVAREVRWQLHTFLGCDEWHSSVSDVEVKSFSASSA